MKTIVLSILALGIILWVHLSNTQVPEGNQIHAIQHLKCPPGFEILKDTQGYFGVKMPFGTVIETDYLGHNFLTRQQAINRAWKQWELANKYTHKNIEPDRHWKPDTQ